MHSLAPPARIAFQDTNPPSLHTRSQATALKLIVCSLERVPEGGQDEFLPFDLLQAKDKASPILHNSPLQKLALRSQSVVVQATGILPRNIRALSFTHAHPPVVRSTLPIPHASSCYLSPAARSLCSLVLCLLVSRVRPEPSQFPITNGLTLLSLSAKLHRKRTCLIQARGI